jgi:uncharacterized RDD family membrane protein YckC
MDRAGVGPRAIAVIIDSLVFGVAACCFFLVIALAAGGEFEQTGGPALLIQFGFGLLYYGYFIVLEGTSGTTLGKRVLKLKVVRVDGSPITMQDSVVRNLLRIIDGLFFYLVAALLVWTSPEKQRLGDRLAKTIVVGAGPGVQETYTTTPEQRF